MLYPPNPYWKIAMGDFIKTHCVISMVLLAGCVAGCSEKTNSGIFVAQFENEVDMLNIVEAPAGHLSGTLTDSSVDLGGNREEKLFNISGSIYQGNISFQVSSDPFSNTNAVGTKNNGEIRLSIGSKTEIFKEMTSQEYAAALALLDKKRTAIQNSKLALESKTEFLTYLSNLKNDLNTFLKWGNERISRAPQVRQWYANRISQYEKCLDTVRPLAARHVPSWKWQSCVLNMDNDKFNRDQLTESIKQAQKTDINQESDLGSKIQNIQQRLSNAVDTWNRTCSPDIKFCNVGTDDLRNEANSTDFIALIEEYRSTATRVRSALADDESVKDNGERKLSALLHEADDLYQHASN